MVQNVRCSTTPTSMFWNLTWKTLENRSSPRSRFAKSEFWASDHGMSWGVVSNKPIGVVTTLLDVVFLMFLIGFWKSFSHWLHWLQRYRKVFSLHVHQSTPFITISMMYLLLVSKLGAGNLFHEATFGRQPVTSLGLVLWPIDPPTYGGQMPPALRSSYPAVG